MPGSFGVHLGLGDYGDYGDDRDDRDEDDEDDEDGDLDQHVCLTGLMSVLAGLFFFVLITSRYTNWRQLGAHVD